MNNKYKSWKHYIHLVVHFIFEHIQLFPVLPCRQFIWFQLQLPLNILFDIVKKEAKNRTDCFLINRPSICCYFLFLLFLFISMFISFLLISIERENENDIICHSILFLQHNNVQKIYDSQGTFYCYCSDGVYK